MLGEKNKRKKTEEKKQKAESRRQKAEEIPLQFFEGVPEGRGS
jgi:hypothetical protein